MNLLVVEDEKKPVRSLWDDRPHRFPSFVLGEAIPFAVGRLSKIRDPFDARLFQPEDMTAQAVQASLGGGFILPSAGKWSITYGANTSDVIIPAQPTAEDIASALNDLASVLAAGGVTVAGEHGFFTITFDAVGARTLISGLSSELVPLTLLDFEAVTEGDASTREVQILRITQNAGAVATLATDSAAGSITLTTVQTGTASVNHQIRIAISDEVYAGQWRFKKAANASALIGWNDSAAQIKTAIEAVTGIGTGNVDVQQEDDHQWFIEFIGSLSLAAVADLTVLASNLRAIEYKSGELDLRNPGTELLLNGANSRVVSFELTATASGGTPRKIMHQDVLLVRPVTDASTTMPNLSGLGLTDVVGSSTAVTVSTTGTTDLAPPNAFIQWDQRIVVGAGVAGLYTRNVTLDTANAVRGATFHVRLEVAASANPTVKFYSNVVAGSALQTITPDSSNPQYLTLVFVKGATEWEFDGFLR